MYTFNDLQHPEKIEHDRQAMIREQLADVQARLADAETAQRMAATAKDAEAYIRAEIDVKALQGRVEALQKDLDGPLHFERDNVLAIWKDYADEYNQAFDKKLAAYKAARHKAAQLYFDLVKGQGTALAQRQHFARLAGADHAEILCGGPLDMEQLHLLDADPMKAVGHGNVMAHPDTVCYIQDGEIPRAAFAGMKMIVDSQIPATIDTVMPTGLAYDIALKSGCIL